MKRLLSLALLGAVALAVPLANAQMRGGGGMMGGRGPVMSHGPVGGGAGFSRGPAVVRGPAFGGGPAVVRGPAFGGGPAVVRGPAFAPRGPVGAPRAAFVAGRPTGTRFVTPSGHVFFTTTPFTHFNHFHHHHFFISACIGFPCFNPFFGSNPFFFGSNFGFGWPFWSAPYYGYGGGYYPSDYTSAQPQQAVSSDTSSQVELAREVQQLSDQIEELRYEESRRAEQKTPPAPSPATSLSARTPAVATTFVMRDGSHVPAENYALTGQTLWIFNEHKARKIAVSDIDREATEKFNAANGIYLRLP